MGVTLTCHIGELRVDTQARPTALTDWQCSIFSRLGALWAYYPDAGVEVCGPTQPYVCDKRVIAFYRCVVCGCLTHLETLGREFGRTGVNARLRPPSDRQDIAVVVVAGPTLGEIVEDDAPVQGGPKTGRARCRRRTSPRLASPCPG